MKRKKIMIVALCSCLFIGLAYGVWKHCHTEEVIEETSALSNVLGDVKISNDTVSAEFETYEEAMEYIGSMDTITIEDATDFITDFYKTSLENSLGSMLIYYYEELWDSVASNEYVPFYDSENLVYGEISNLKVSEKKDTPYVYKATYDLHLFDTNTKEKVATLEREDEIYLMKVFTQLFIAEYSRKTIRSEFYE